MQLKTALLLVALLTCVSSPGLVAQGFGPVHINPGKTYVMPFMVDKPGKLSGIVNARGGQFNDIRVLVLEAGTVVFDSGQRSTVLVDVPVSPGRYDVVFDNRFSMIASKTVWPNVGFTPNRENPTEPPSGSSRGAPPDSKDQRKAMVYEVREQLLPALEQVLAQAGIQQSISKKDWKNWWAEEGLFQLAEAGRESYQDILAAAMAHEFVHRTRAEANGTRLSNAVGDIWQEMRGTVAWSPRTEENLIDEVTVRVLCKAGFKPELFLMVMDAFLKREEQADGAVRYHPRLRERADALRPICHCEQPAP